MAVVTERVPPPEGRTKITLEQFWALPEGPPDYEFDQGEVMELPRPHGQHQRVLKRLLGFLDQYVSQNHLGEVWPEIDVELPPGRVYVPDLCYLGSERASHYSEEDGRIHGAPDLAIEIMSPSTMSRDRLRKFNAYFEAGVPWYWMVDPQSLDLEEYRSTPEGYLRTASVEAGDSFQPGLFPGLEINLRELLGTAAAEEGDPE